MIRFSCLVAMWFTFALGNLNSFAAEIKIGENHLTCENQLLGTFEIQFLVKDQVTHTEYSDNSNKKTPTWEVLQAQLIQLEFTAGKLIEPKGFKTSLLSGATITAFRNVQDGPRMGILETMIELPKNSDLPISYLSVDHSHSNYETPELIAQTMAFFDKKLVQLFFNCH